MSESTYSEAGVSIDKGNEFARMIKERIRKAWPHAADEIGKFAGMLPVPYGGKLFSVSTDGTGTKAIIAANLEEYDGIGQDAVAMAAVDTYIAGFQPSAAVDTLDVGSLDPEKHIQIINSIIRGCKKAGCVLIGGETAELPDLFHEPWMFTVNVTVVGFPIPGLVRRTNHVQPGQTVYGWPSYGLASNGFSLVRKVFDLVGNQTMARARLHIPHGQLGDRTLADVLLEPTPIWIHQIEEERLDGALFTGHAHITGGGFVENIPRILPEHVKVVLDRSRIKRPPIFPMIEKVGDVSREEMERVFNNGVMIVSIVAPGGMSGLGYPAFEIGHVAERTSGEPQVEFIGDYLD